MTPLGLSRVWLCALDILSYCRNLPYGNQSGVFIWVCHPLKCVCPWFLPRLGFFFSTAQVSARWSKVITSQSHCEHLIMKPIKPLDVAIIKQYEIVLRISLLCLYFVFYLLLVYTVLNFVLYIIYDLLRLGKCPGQIGWIRLLDSSNSVTKKVIACNIL